MKRRRLIIIDSAEGSCCFTVGKSKERERAKKEKKKKRKEGAKTRSSNSGDQCN